MPRKINVNVEIVSEVPSAALALAADLYGYVALSSDGAVCIQVGPMAASRE